MVFQPAWMPPLLTGFPINFFFQFNVNKRLENHEVFHSTLRLKFDGGHEKLNCLLGAHELKISEFCSEFLSFSNYFCGFYRLKLCCCCKGQNHLHHQIPHNFPQILREKSWMGVYWEQSRSTMTWIFFVFHYFFKHSRTS